MANSVNLDSKLDPSFWGGTEQPDSTLDWPGPAPEAPSAPPEPAKPEPPKPENEPARTPPAPPPKPRNQAKGGKFRLRIGPEVEEAEELITTEKAKSWGTSLVFHLVLFLLMLVPFIPRITERPKQLEAGLPAGDPHGSDLGQFFTGGEGMDEPLAMPLLDVVEPVDTTKLTSNALSPIAPNVAASAPAPPDGSRSGGGVALTGTGQAGKGDGFGVAKFGLGGTETVNNVKVKVGNPQFTLIWDTNVDLDLHVQEPGGSHISFEYRNGRRGGELDVDDVDGHGPENIYWGGGLNKGNGPPGVYKWYVHYYGGSMAEYGQQIMRTPTRWRVRLKHNGTYKVFEGKLNAVGQQSKVESFVVEESEENKGIGGDAQGREGDRERFNNPPSQMGGMREVNTGSFDAEGARPGGSMPNETERPATRNAETPAAPMPAPATPRRPTGPPRDDSGWVIVKPEGKGIEARMPDDPFEETRATTVAGVESQLLTWVLRRIEGEYSLAVVDIPADRIIGEAKPLLEKEARKEVEDAGGTNVSLKEVTVHGVTGVEVEADLPDRIVAGGGKVRARRFLAGRRLVRASALGTKEFVSGGETRRFLDSIELKAP